MSFDWKSALGSIAPTIATALGGPLAGQAVSAIGAALLGNPDASEEDVAHAVANATPEQLLALKQEDHNFALQMRAHGINLVNSTQKQLTERMKLDMQSDSWLSKNIRPAVLIYLMALFTIAFFRDVPEQTLSLLQSLLLTVFVFYFGSRSLEKITNSLIAGKKG